MSTTAPAAPTLARGTLESVTPPTATRPASIVLTIPGSQYRLHLHPAGGLEAIRTPIGKKIAGTINCQARRVDAVTTGGRLIEPVDGRPRRIHGTVLAVNPSAGTITVNAGGSSAVDGVSIPVIAKLGDARQRPDQFAVGALVAFDVLAGATFTPSA
ncbi:MAG: hypothetical protein AB7K52_01930 [Phycisphaerales bacterium]